MDEKSFWLLIDESRDRAWGETSSDRADDQAMHLTAILKTLPPEEIREFDRIFQHYRARAFHWDLWGAAFLVQGGCSDDSFDYFRAWLMAQGEAVFARILGNPESLLEVALAEPDPMDVILEGERMLYAAEDAWREVTGRTEPDFDRVPHPAEPAGEPWTEAELAERLPRLAEKYDCPDE